MNNNKSLPVDETMVDVMAKNSKFNSNLFSILVFFCLRFFFQLPFFFYRPDFIKQKKLKNSCLLSF